MRTGMLQANWRIRNEVIAKMAKDKTLGDLIFEYELEKSTDDLIKMADEMEENEKR